MSKAILVIDMPEKCNGCMFCNFTGHTHGGKYGGYSEIWCKAWGVITGDSSSFYIKGKEKHHMCPLRELPEKKAVMGIDGVSGRTEILESGKQRGWNDCIDAITGEKKNENRSGRKSLQ